MYAEGRLEAEIIQDAMSKIAVSVVKSFRVRWRNVPSVEWFHVNETCYRYQSKLSSENDLIYNWLVSLTTAQSD